MNLRALQEPIKESHRADPGQARVTLSATGRETDSPVACSVDIGRAIQQAVLQTLLSPPQIDTQLVATN